jgi:hypothetical protein
VECAEENELKKGKREEEDGEAKYFTFYVLRHGAAGKKDVT